MTTSEDLITLAGNAFIAADQASAIILARKLFGTVEGDSDGADLATAMLAYAILLNRRQGEKGKTDNSLAALDLDKLITPEMERLLTKSLKPTSVAALIGYKQLATNKHWSV